MAWDCIILNDFSESRGKKFLPADRWVRLFRTPSIPQEATLTRLARIGNKVSVEISYGWLSHKIGWINHVVGELVDANGLVESGGDGVARQTFAYDGYALPLLLTSFLRSRSSFCLRSSLQPLRPDRLRRRSRRLGAFRSWAARRSKETDIAGNIQLFALIRSVWESWRAIPIPVRLHIRHTKTHPTFAPIARLRLLPRAARATLSPSRARVHRLLKRHPLEIYTIPYASSFRIFMSDLWFTLCHPRDGFINIYYIYLRICRHLDSWTIGEFYLIVKKIVCNANSKNILKISDNNFCRIRHAFIIASLNSK